MHNHCLCGYYIVLDKDSVGYTQVSAISGRGWGFVLGFWSLSGLVNQFPQLWGGSFSVNFTIIWSLEDKRLELILPLISWTMNVLCTKYFKCCIVLIILQLTAVNLQVSSWSMLSHRWAHLSDPFPIHKSASHYTHFLYIKRIQDIQCV